MSTHRVLIVGAGRSASATFGASSPRGGVRVSFVEVDPDLRGRSPMRYPRPSPTRRSTRRLAAAARMRSSRDAGPAARPPGDVSWSSRGIRTCSIEKPLGMSLDGVDELVRLVAERRVVAAVAYVMRTQPRCANTRRGAGPPDASAIRSNWSPSPDRTSPILSAGLPEHVLLCICVLRRRRGPGRPDARVNAGEWLVGKIDRVVADAAHLKIEGVDVEDTVHVLARHGDVLASYACNQHQAPNEIDDHRDLRARDGAVRAARRPLAVVRMPGRAVGRPRAGASLDRDLPFIPGRRVPGRDRRQGAATLHP